MPTIKQEILDAVAAEKAQLLAGIEAKVKAGVEAALAKMNWSDADKQEVFTAISDIFTPEGSTGGSTGNASLALVATGKSIVSAKFEVINDDPEAVQLVKDIATAATDAAAAQADGGSMTVSASLVTNIEGTGSTVQLTSLHKILKAQQTAINAFKIVVDNQCAVEGI